MPVFADALSSIEERMRRGAPVLLSHGPKDGLAQPSHSRMGEDGGSNMRRLLIAGLLGTLLSCGSLQSRALLVHPGDDKDRVTALLGKPGDRQFKGDNEVWQYCKPGDDYRMVWLYRGKVIGVTSYKEPHGGVLMLSEVGDHTSPLSCTGHFRQVRWEDPQRP